MVVRTTANQPAAPPQVDVDDARSPTPEAVPVAETVEPTHDFNLARAILEFEPHKDHTNAAWTRVIERLRTQGYPHKRSIAGLKLQFGKFLKALMTAAPNDKPATEMRTLLQEYGKSEGVQLTRAMQELVGASQQPGDRRPDSARAAYEEADAEAVPGDHGPEGRRVEPMPARARGDDTARRVRTIEVAGDGMKQIVFTVRD